jgi:hypothetical protein
MTINSRTAQVARNDTGTIALVKVVPPDEETTDDHSHR